MPNLQLAPAAESESARAPARAVPDSAQHHHEDPRTRMHWARRVLARIARATQTLNRIIGAPDYETYVAHARRCHPDAPLLTRDAFVAQRLEDRYSRPGARCC